MWLSSAIQECVLKPARQFWHWFHIVQERQSMKSIFSGLVSLLSASSNAGTTIAGEFVPRCSSAQVAFSRTLESESFKQSDKAGIADVAPGNGNSKREAAKPRICAFWLVSAKINRATASEPTSYKSPAAALATPAFLSPNRLMRVGIQISRPVPISEKSLRFGCAGRSPK